MKEQTVVIFNSTGDVRNYLMTKRIVFDDRVQGLMNASINFVLETLYKNGFKIVMPRNERENA